MDMYVHLSLKSVGKEEKNELYATVNMQAK